MQYLNMSANEKHLNQVASDFAAELAEGALPSALKARFESHGAHPATAEAVVKLAILKAEERANKEQSTH